METIENVISITRRAGDREKRCIVPYGAKIEKIGGVMFISFGIRDKLHGDERAYINMVDVIEIRTRA